MTTERTVAPVTPREAMLEAELTRLLRALRHDLRSPLTAIATNAALLLEDPLTDDQRRALLDVREGGRRMVTMLTELETQVQHVLDKPAAP